MGLAERKQKQRIGADPRNLTWSEDTSRFGQQYLAKYGWDHQSGRGLGANGDGRTKHISVVKRLDAMGIGGKPSGPDAAAWKQNKDFENVLKRLNMSEDDNDMTQAEKKKDDSVARAYLQGFVRAEKIGATFDSAEKEEVVTPGEDDPAIIKAKRKEEKKKRKADTQDDIIEEKQTPKIPPHMAHRAKFRRSKQLASVSSAALSEILGVSSSTPGTGLSTADASPSPSSTPTFNPMASTSTTSVINDQLTTSSTSVADYFAAKLKARKEQMLHLTPLQNTVEAGGDAGIADTPNEAPAEMEAGVIKSTKKRKKEKKTSAVSDEDDAKEASVVPQEDAEAERRECKRQKKEEKADESKKKKKRLKSEV